VAAGSWNAAMYASFITAGQRHEDSGPFLDQGSLAGPLALVLALRFNFGAERWSLSNPHQCAHAVGHDDALDPQEMLDRSY